jgi:hypothetical protein
MAEDEVGTMETLTSHRVILDGLIAEHQGLYLRRPDDEELVREGLRRAGLPA